MKEQLISQLEQLLKQDDLIKIGREVRHLQGNYRRLLRETAPATPAAADDNNATDSIADTEDASPEALNTEISAENPAPAAAPQKTASKDMLDEHFDNLIKEYYQKVEIARIISATEEQKKLLAKRELLHELRGLVQEAEQGRVNFEQMKGLRLRWNEIGRVNAPEYADTQSDFNFLMDKMTHHIQVIREMRDIDHQRNLNNKQQIISALQTLSASEMPLRDVEKELRHLQTQWYESGQVPIDKKDEINQNYRHYVDGIMQKIDGHYSTKREEMGDNLKKKVDLCDAVQAICERPLEGQEAWKQATEEIQALQTQWKEIGYSTNNEEAWAAFRQVCDTFYNKRREHFGGIDEMRRHSAEIKKALCEKAVALQHSQDWQAAGDQFVQLQKEWKAAGPAPQKEENELWQRFRTACDVFFNARKEHNESVSVIYEENLAKKLALLEEISNYSVEENAETAFDRLRDYNAQWNEIGFVPIKSKKEITKRFQDVIDAKFTIAKALRTGARAQRLEEHLNTMRQDRSSSPSQEYERRGSQRNPIEQKIQSLRDEISNYENNLGFLKDNGKPNPIREQIQQNIERARNEMNILYQQMNAKTENNNTPPEAAL